MNTTQALIYVPGLAFSTGGTVMWAWNDFGIWLVEVGKDLGHVIGSSLRVVLVRVHLAKPRVITGAAAQITPVTGFATGNVTPGEGTPIEHQVAFLLGAVGEHEHAIQLLRHELNWKIDDVRNVLLERIPLEVQRLSSDNIRVRRAGVAFVIIGIVLLAVAPFAG